ncbi:MAG TPA: glutamine--fructose-6-phosphate transaminase (isomerizing) [Candidatus Paceibacterota bacterium]|jgi:glucosamine--fructose-6-phosphate aminotransferase (isomerizing)|nr:glutamine--fructose-6-phosphate transaminase (isomerizing) [Candidatus Paceibacterota bacterium]
MCGIVGYIGKRKAYPILIKGLERLEYRGYDSAGVALLENNIFSVYKKKGKVAELSKFVKKTDNLSGGVGIAHTRWATHGEPSDINAHPQVSASGDIVLVHNGIIENYLSIKKILIEKGYKFKSDTDTEVLVNLIEDIKKNAKVNIDEAVRLALHEVVGAYAILVLSNDEPNTMIVAKVGSPVVIGIGEKEFFIASDATPIVEYTKKVVYLEDREIAIIRNGKLVLKTIQNEIKNPYVQKLEMKIEELEKGGFPHFMLKEIFEQPRSIKDSMRGRINAKNGTVKLGGIEKHEDRLLNAKRIIILACGTSWHAGLTAKYFFEELANVPVSVEYASEFRYRNPVIYADDVVIAISQSGETADTLAAASLAKNKGTTIFGICNVVGSSIPRLTDAGIYTHAGPEIGVASTKAFTAQITALMLLCLWLASEKKLLKKKEMEEILSELENIPKKVEKALLVNDGIKKIAKKFQNAKNFIFLGRGYGFPLALEGALKLKEISYIHSEGLAMGEMKHGPIALVDADMPVVFIATKGPMYEKVVSNIMEVKARKGKIIAIITKGDTGIKKIADYVIEIPKTSDLMMPFLASVPLQLLAYHIALLRGCDIDKPRNLAKSVTVE